MTDKQLQSSENDSQIIIYQTENGQTKIDVRLEEETVWLTIDQMSQLFQKARSTINEHIINIFKENELEKELSAASPYVLRYNFNAA